MVSKARLIAGLINADGDVKDANLDNLPDFDSAQITTIIPASVDFYSTLDSLPVTGLSNGDRAFVESSGSGARLYISNGSGWYNAAMINLSPTMTLDQSGTIQLNADTLSATVTITATDSDNANLIFSVESDGNMLATGVTVSQDSSVFTITSLTADSGGVAGDFDLTFKTSDGINQATESLSFTLSFSTVVDSSAPTVLLMKAVGDGIGNGSITHLIDSANSSTNFVEQNGPEAATFTPYRSGGYSVYFDGSGDRLEIDSPIGDLSSTNYTIEGWYYFLTDPNSSTYLLWTLNDDGGNGYAQLQTLSSTTTLRLQQRGGAYLSDGTFDFDTNTWYHIATVWDGTNMKVYVNGAEALTSTTNVVQNAGNGLCVNGDGGGNLQFKGYIRDFRIVTSAVYTSAGFAPPTEPLTAITGTDVLLCHLPYIADGSSNSYTVTPSNDAMTAPFGPYDYSPWIADVGGSVKFVSTSNLRTTATAVNAVGNTATKEYTVEGWLYLESYPTTGGALFSKGTSGTTAPGNAIVVGQIRSAGAVYCSVDGNFSSSHITTANGTLRLKEWCHIALTKTSAGLHTLYINGVSKGTYTKTNVNMSASTNAYIGGIMYDPDAAARTLNGYVADVRVTDEVIYTGAFTPPTAPLSQTSNTTLLMQNKSDANIYDASASGTFDVGNDAASSTSSRKFSTSSSVVFDGTGDFLNIDNYTDLFQFGDNDFTIEGWYKADTTSSDHYIISFSGGTFNAATSHFGINIYQGNWRAGGFNDKLVGGVGSGVNTGIDTTTWHHFALVHASQNLKYYIDGTQIGSTVSTTGDTFNCGSTACIGGYHSSNGSLNWDGYLQDIRITKGFARYTANFTAPAAEFEL